MKPGQRTTEFLLVIISQISGLITFILTHSNNSSYENIAIIIAPSLIIMMYIWSRTQIKRVAGKTQVTELHSIFDSLEDVEFIQE